MAEYALPVILADDEDLAKGAGLAAAAAGVAYGSYRLGKYLGNSLKKRQNNGPHRKFSAAGKPKRGKNAKVHLM